MRSSDNPCRCTWPHDDRTKTRLRVHRLGHTVTVEPVGPIAVRSPVRSSTHSCLPTVIPWTTCSQSTHCPNSGTSCPDRLVQPSSSDTLAPATAVAECSTGTRRPEPRTTTAWWWPLLRNRQGDGPVWIRGPWTFAGSVPIRQRMPPRPSRGRSRLPIVEGKSQFPPEHSASVSRSASPRVSTCREPDCCRC